jgi:hypothetical protein
MKPTLAEYRAQRPPALDRVEAALVALTWLYERLRGR